MSAYSIPSVPRHGAVLAAAIAVCLAAAPASATTIGVVAPTAGPYAMLGQQILRGAKAAAAAGDTLIPIAESCEQGAGKAIADKLKQAGATAAIGFLCVETLSESLPLLKEAGIAAITVSVRSKILMEDATRYGWPFFRLAPVDGEEASRLAEIVLSKFQNKSIALVDDGTIYGRELTGAIRQKLEAGGIKPAFADTFRPGQEQQLALVRRLVKAGVSHVVVGGDRADVSVMVRDAAAEKAALTFIGGDVMRAADRPVPLADGVLAVALVDYATLPAASAAVAALRATGSEADGYTLPAYAAVQMARAASVKAASGKTAIVQALPGLAVDTVLGPLTFGADHELAENPFRLQEWRGGAFQPANVERK
ncbi:branched-chain amino acid transport system substrate-binding protein [Neorhizobium galegae]|uniref:branched-chain amino acid ABC transporter substrate-binding protein n=1 Tax=Neorhizobium galegae TaxID=399 RepID=UPI001AE1F71F|nr:branched-chain amino acid ABC transporter substrate-binding protein [Neorhizobium galegae]MBP2549395.1 branched-chain amino acid transport system substrate-binding protein [Neorhizobium galegae]